MGQSPIIFTRNLFLGRKALPKEKVAPEERAKFKGLEYYPPNADYRFELELHEHSDKKRLQIALFVFLSKKSSSLSSFRCA